MDESKLQKIDEKTSFKFKFTIPKIPKGSDHLETLALNKPEYHSRDFFNKQEFRGLFLADH